MAGKELEQVAATAREAELAAAPWVEKMARVGFAAKGVVYVLIGAIAARVALGGRGDIEGWNGSIGTLRDEPLGHTMLWVIGFGLASHVVWRFVEALRNPERDDLPHRVFHLFGGLVYGALALAAFRLAAGGSSGSDRHWTSTLMEQPFGRVLVLLAGVGIAGYGLQQIWRAWSSKLDKRLDLSRVSAPARAWVIRLGRAGLAARGVVMLVLGYMFLRAAQRADASEPGNVGGVLGSMRDQPWLLAGIALGLIAYGVFNVVLGRYRRIRAA